MLHEFIDIGIHLYISTSKIEVNKWLLSFVLCINKVLFYESQNNSFCNKIKVDCELANISAKIRCYNCVRYLLHYYQYDPTTPFCKKMTFKIKTISCESFRGLENDIMFCIDHQKTVLPNTYHSFRYRIPYALHVTVLNFEYFHV